MAESEHHQEEHSNGRCGHHDHSHFLVVAYSLQGHLNPARTLARRLARVHGSARVTLSVTESGHSRMFPSLASPDEEASDGLISYVPHSDGFKFGTRPRDTVERARCRRASIESLSAIVRRLAATGRPVTCIVSALSLPAADVALGQGIPLAIYWIQPATALVAYYHYFHGYEQLVASHVTDPAYEVLLPGLHPLRIRDFPSYLVDAAGSEHTRAGVQWVRALLEHIGREKPKVLVNTFDVLEATALEAMRQHLDVLAVGRTVPHLHQTDAAEERIHLYKDDEKTYMQWLDAQPERSVVYMSFGSMLTYSKQQAAEILLGLRQCRRPYLWVVRKDGRDQDVERCLPDNGGQGQGMVLEWCDQLGVLSHPSVGCFVTHCGWNSTLEATTSGVPMVCAPSWSDQALNAHLVEDQWGVGVRAERNAEGVLVGAELARCIELVMDDGDKAALEMRERAKTLKEKVQEFMVEGEPIELTLRSFVEAMQIPR